MKAVGLWENVTGEDRAIGGELVELFNGSAKIKKVFPGDFSLYQIPRTPFDSGFRKTCSKFVAFSLQQDFHK
jgi:hypothetical protein